MRSIYRKVEVPRNAALIGFFSAFTLLGNQKIYYHPTTLLRLYTFTYYILVKKPLYIKLLF